MNTEMNTPTATASTAQTTGLSTTGKLFFVKKTVSTFTLTFKKFARMMAEEGVDDEEKMKEIWNKMLHDQKFMRETACVKTKEVDGGQEIELDEDDDWNEDAILPDVEQLIEDICEELK